MLKDGLYEQVINNQIEDELATTNKLSQTTPIDDAEASKILANYITDIVEKGLECISENGGDIHSQIDLINKIISIITFESKVTELQQMSVARRAEQLLALLDPKNSILSLGRKTRILRPETSIAQSSLFTGAIHEPQMYNELNKEINSCNRIDMLVSFIKWSGLRLLIDELTAFTQKGGNLRIITTSYMGATDVKAIEELRKLPNTKIMVSYDTKRTRLHAKTYVFYRDTGFTTAYVGSSNLSNAALSSGLEWNVKVTKKDLPQTIDKITATFESYWNSNEFEYYSEDQKQRLTQALMAEKYFGSNNNVPYTLDIRPYSYQQEILDKLEAERTVRGYMRNLVVAATGTGKTVISALDYRHFKIQNHGKPCRLMFVAHRKEILEQSLYTFQAVLKDANFGEMFTGNYRPDSLDHLFISIQTFNSQDFTEKTTADFYDYIVVDEFHHAAANSYQKLLEYYNPKILLGLTATPERMDGKDILPYFNNRIAAEIRLPEAINRKLLSPFQYFGVTDTTNLTELRWSRGGYDKNELSRLYTLSGHAAKRRANMVISSIYKYVTDIEDVKGLGFCVSIEHAKFMSNHFNTLGIPSMYLMGQSSDDDRNNAKKRLIEGEVRFIFVVDIYNEGVDIPEVNTVLFLRPTESLTIFLQQLGRGLRLCEGKECLTVLDFIGQANKKYNFEDKFAALLSNTTRSVQREIKDGFVSVPKGCYIKLEKKAAQYVLDNIRSSYGNSAGLVSRIESFSEDSNLPLNLVNFLEYYHLNPQMIYKYSSFSRLCARANQRDDFDEPLELLVSKALTRFAAVDSRRWISFLLNILTTGYERDFGEMELRMLQMFQFTIWQKPYDECGFANLKDGIDELKRNPVMCAELIELLEYNYSKIDFIDQPVDVGFNCPLDLHCAYTRDQILVAMDFMKPSTVREGVKWLSEKQLDLFFITLNKSDKDYSPTTMYKDYSINETMFHWQSQSTTSDLSPTGNRYINHKQLGSEVLLFVREFRTDRISGNTAPYTYLGTANYLCHEGSKPMSITWHLDEPIPAKFLKKTSKLIVG